MCICFFFLSCLLSSLLFLPPSPCSLSFALLPLFSCVGLRNYRFFFGYIFSVLLLGLYVFGLVFELLIQLSEERRAEQSKEVQADSSWKDYFEEACRENIPLCMLGSFGGCVALSLFGLALYHLNLIRVGETTNEAIRGVYSRHINPFNRGFSNNFQTMIMDPMPPSQLEFLTKQVTSDSIPGMALSEADMVRRRNFGRLVSVNQSEEAREFDPTQPAGSVGGVYSYQADQPDIENQDEDASTNLLDPKNNRLSGIAAQNKSKQQQNHYGRS